MHEREEQHKMLTELPDFPGLQDAHSSSGRARRIGRGAFLLFDLLSNHGGRVAP